MKIALGIFTTSLVAATLIPMSIASAQTAAQSIDQPFVHPKWTGVWEGKLDGIPSVTLTLADDAGDANGTIVFHAIKNDNGHAYSFSTEPHTLMNRHIEGNTLSFQVKRGNGSVEILNMAVELRTDGNAGFNCTNCGPEEVRADLQRIQ